MHKKHSLMCDYLKKTISRLFCCRLPKYLQFPCCRRRDELILATDSNTTNFTLKGMCFRGKILKLESDMKFSLAMIFPDKIYKMKCELYGFQSILSKIPEDKFRQNLPADKYVYIVCHDFTHDGRLQVTLYEDMNRYSYHDISLNEILLIQSQAISNKEDLEKLFDIDLNECQ